LASVKKFSELDLKWRYFLSVGGELVEVIRCQLGSSDCRHSKIITIISVSFKGRHQ